MLVDLEQQRTEWQKLKTKQEELRAQLKVFDAKSSSTSEQKIAEGKAQQAIGEETDNREEQLADAEQLEGVSNSSLNEQHIIDSRIDHLRKEKQQDNTQAQEQAQALVTAEKAVKAADEEHATAQQKEKVAVQAALNARKELAQLQLKLDASHTGSEGPLLDEDRMMNRQTETEHKVSELMQDEAVRATEYKQAAKKYKATDQALAVSTAREHAEQTEETAAETAAKTARSELAEAEAQKHQMAREAQQHEAAMSEAELTKVCHTSYIKVSAF